MANSFKIPPRDQVGPDTPLRLDVAATLAYPDGSMTASGLRKEAKRKRLAIERVAGKDYTTLGAISEMRELCRQSANPHVSGSSPKNGTTPANSPTSRCGTSKTEITGKALAAARAMLMAPSQRS